MSVLCVCMTDVMSEFNSDRGITFVLCSDVVSVVYSASYVFWK